MSILHVLERSMSMDESVWARHANSWSVWTRMVTLPFLFLALYSHVWFGWPVAIVLLVALSVWIWLNPRLFAIPSTTKTWAAKATFGERVLLNKKSVPIPAHHERMVRILTPIAGAGFFLGVAGAILTNAWMTASGAVVCYAGKMWFLDRMVWLYEDMKSSNPEYAGWEY